jgi:hypothetical protein
LYNAPAQSRGDLWANGRRSLARFVHHLGCRQGGQPEEETIMAQRNQQFGQGQPKQGDQDRQNRQQNEQQREREAQEREKQRRDRQDEEEEEEEN